MSKKVENREQNEVASKNFGNFTKAAVKQFENNIINQTDYLEKVDNIKEENANKQPDSYT